MVETQSNHTERTPQSKVLSTAHGPIEVSSTGAGYPVIALHGCPGGYDQGLLVGDRLSGAGFHVIAPSRPGYLRTPLESGRTPA